MAPWNGAQAHHRPASRDTRPGVHYKGPRVGGPASLSVPIQGHSQRERKGPIRAALQGSNASSTLPVPHPPRTVPASNPSEL